MRNEGYELFMHVLSGVLAELVNMQVLYSWNDYEWYKYTIVWCHYRCLVLKSEHSVCCK